MPFNFSKYYTDRWDRLAGKINRWDPLTGQPCQYNTNEFMDVIVRARKVLNNRKLKEILTAQKALDKAFQDIDKFLGLHKDPNNWNYRRKMGFITLRRYMSLVIKKKYKIPVKSKKPFSWPECYAMLSLGLSRPFDNIDTNKDLVVEFIQRVYGGIEAYEGLRKKTAERFLNEAIEMIETAERLIKKKPPENMRRTFHYSTYQILKLQFLDELEDVGLDNISEAARQFYRNRPEKYLRLKSESDQNIVRFFWKAFRQSDLYTKF